MSVIISIQSQVIYGHVGNSAAVFPMQACGHQVIAVPTTLLSNHPHYPTLHGAVLDPDLVAGLLIGVEERGVIERATHIITGYLGSVQNAHVVADFIKRAKTRNPALRFVCDPVMGDDDLGIFVDKGLPDEFRTELLPWADCITPNQFELELLCGCKARSARAIADIVADLNAQRPLDVVTTGCVLDDSRPGHVETVAAGPHGFSRHAVLRLPIRPCGTGDLFTALLVSRLANGAALEAATGWATDTIHAVLRRTHDADSKEMQMTGFLFADPDKG